MPHGTREPLARVVALETQPVVIQNARLVSLVKERRREDVGLGLAQGFEAIQKCLVDKQPGELVQLAAEGVRRVFACGQTAAAECALS